MLVGALPLSSLLDPHCFSSFPLRTFTMANNELLYTPATITITKFLNSSTPAFATTTASLKALTTAAVAATASAAALLLLFITTTLLLLLQQL